MRALLLTVLLFTLPGLVPSASAQSENESIEWNGFLALRGGGIEGPNGWPQGGFGRFDGGADGPEDRDFWGRAEGQFGFDWNSTGSWRGRVHALARLEEDEVPGPAVGLTEAWLGYQRATSDRSELMVRGGLFFYPSSQENVDPLWGSPYTLNYSAINSWFAEEFRPIGLDAEQRFFLDSGREWSLGATVFGGNDTLGTLLVWRGWTMHDRLSVLGEDLALPPVFSLESDGAFGQNQRAFRTTAFGEDFDDRPGWALRARLDQPGAFNVQLAWVDNRGDRRLYEDEYAWRTQFLLLGAFWQLSERFELIAEATRGRTRMNFPGQPWVDADFDAVYLMGSWLNDLGRWSLRHDRFGVSDQIDRASWGIFDDRGQAWTLAWIRAVGQRSRLGVEWSWLDANRPVALASGASPDAGGMRLMLEWRWLF
ncbi:hypothetical protein [Wenzhouxiangella marina]|uniref:Uncharacterized protein n=1 Tax=Wenzhouxiangella marina TaxID=1579979 RepID=A0A0K0XY78_9GAMM|nr:hypothetical protein [Wenzhouxiangella marina]AKS42582.1 hypothetical protein WM2015_2219 [Wenzhouxiangella marina]MBB6085636.1 hypothetical protein [Wenzhouxiangella marina]